MSWGITKKTGWGITQAQLDAGLATKENLLWFTPENISNKWIANWYAWLNSSWLADDYVSRIAPVEVFGYAEAVTTGDGKRFFRIPAELNGYNLVSVGAQVVVASSSGTPTIQIARWRQSAPNVAHAFVDMLETLNPLTIEVNEFDSKDATTAAVINTSNDDIATGDMIRIDVDTAGTGTTGLCVTLSFRLP